MDCTHGNQDMVDEYGIVGCFDCYMSQELDHYD